MLIFFNGKFTLILTCHCTRSLIFGQLPTEIYNIFFLEHPNLWSITIKRPAKMFKTAKRESPIITQVFCCSSVLRIHAHTLCSHPQTLQHGPVQTNQEPRLEGLLPSVEILPANQPLPMDDRPLDPTQPLPSHPSDVINDVMPQPPPEDSAAVDLKAGASLDADERALFDFINQSVVNSPVHTKASLVPVENDQSGENDPSLANDQVGKPPSTTNDTLSESTKQAATGDMPKNPPLDPTEMDFDMLEAELAGMKQRQDAMQLPPGYGHPSKEDDGDVEKQGDASTGQEDKGAQADSVENNTNAGTINLPTNTSTKPQTASTNLASTANDNRITNANTAFDDPGVKLDLFSQYPELFSGIQPNANTSGGDLSGPASLAGFVMDGMTDSPGNGLDAFMMNSQPMSAQDGDGGGETGSTTGGGTQTQGGNGGGLVDGSAFDYSSMDMSALFSSEGLSALAYPDNNGGEGSL